MSHPQLHELSERLHQFLAGGDNAYLVVHEPESHGSVDFLHYGQTGRKHVPILRTVLFDADEATLATAERLNIGRGSLIEFPLRFGPRRGQIATQVSFRRLVKDAHIAAQIAIDVLRQVFGATDNAWLWITEEYQPDSWPDPLPKPEIWPPHSAD